MVQISEGELKGYRTQGKQLAELEKFKAEIEAKTAEAEEAALRNKNDFATLEKKKNDRIAELEKALTEKDQNILIAEASSKLATDAEGKPLVSSVKARRAMAADWAAKTPDERKAEGAWKAFLKAQQDDDPKAFESPLSGVSGDRAGSPAGSKSKSLDQRIADGDIDAINERARQMLGLDS
jgi:hypothetical protein